MTETMTEVEYNELLARLVKGAQFLENPLIVPEQYEKGMRKYNEIERKVLEYNRLTWQWK